MYVPANLRYSMLQLKIFMLFGLDFHFAATMLCFALVRFRHQKHLVMVWKTSYFCIEILILVTTNTAGDGQTSHVKFPVFVATYTAGNRPEVFLKLSSGFTLTNYSMKCSCKLQWLAWKASGWAVTPANHHPLLQLMWHLRACYVNANWPGLSKCW